MKVMVVLLLPAFCLASDGGFDWPQWRGPERNGISAEAAWLTQWPNDGPKKLWSASVGTGLSSTAISRGKLYTMGNTANQDTVSCLDAETGAPIWKHTYACPLEPKNYPGGPGSTPTVEDDSVYSFSKRGHLFSLDAQTGAVRWTVNLSEAAGTIPPDWGLASSPLIVGDKVIVNAGESGLAADKKTGKILWSSGKGIAAYASPVHFTAGGVDSVAIFSKAGLYGVELSGGKVLWKYPWATDWGENTPDPIVSGERIFLTSGHGLGCTLLNVSGSVPTPIWKNLEVGNHISSSVVYKGNLYGFNGRINKEIRSLNCLDFESGKLKWSQAGLQGQVILAGDKLLILTLDGLLIAAEASPESYKEINRAQVMGGKCWAPPVLSHGRIYVRNGKGDLICLDVRTK